MAKQPYNPYLNNNRPQQSTGAPPRNNATVQGAGQYTRPGTPVSAPAHPSIPIPDNYVDKAERIMKDLQAGRRSDAITTSKLRSLFGLFSQLYTDVLHGDSETLTLEQQNVLLSARVRIVYEIGRDKKGRNDGPVGVFAEKSDLLAYLAGVGNRVKNFIVFYNYIEALVAYHRYYFGELKDRQG